MRRGWPATARISRTVGVVYGKGRKMTYMRSIVDRIEVGETIVLDGEE